MDTADVCSIMNADWAEEESDSAMLDKVKCQMALLYALGARPSVLPHMENRQLPAFVCSAMRCDWDLD